MTKDQKRHGRSRAALRSGLRQAEANFSDLVSILEVSEPDAAYLAHEGLEASRNALRRDERLHR